MQQDNLNQVSQTIHLISSSQERENFSFFKWNSYISILGKTKLVREINDGKNKIPYKFHGRKI